MSSNVHNLIKIEYEKKQKNAYDEQITRKNEIYAKIPRIEELDRLLNLLGLKYGKILINKTLSVDIVMSELNKQLEELQNEKINLLKAYGYPENYMDMVYSCARCKDTGFVDNFSVLEMCKCYKQKLIEYLYKSSNLKSLELDNFNNFNEALYSKEAGNKFEISPFENILNIKKRALSFIDNFSMTEERNLFFSGSTGVGKTFMCSCIAKELLDKGYTVMYQTAPSLFNIINQSKMNHSFDQNSDELCYKNILEVDLLIIDDLGTETPSPARYADFLTVINTRQLNNAQKSCKTIISTNLDASKMLEWYTERVVSRIIGYFDSLTFIGEDIRIKNKKT